MMGFYYYDTRARKWQWHINYMNAQVASGTCSNKGEMEVIIRKHGHVNWIKAH